MAAAALLAASVPAGAAQAAHSADFWRDIAKNHYAVPSGADVPALTGELAGMLSSPDPEIRDELAYSTFAAWIYQTHVIDGDTLRALTRQLLANLKDGTGERGTDRVLRRSFSALTLSVIVARDNAAPFFSADEFHDIERGALEYLDAEQDVRGYDPQRGWMHSAAHTADLLKFIGRSRYLDRDGQRRILDAIARKMTATPDVFTHGEDERFARAVLSIVNRGDFDRAAFAAWASATRPTRVGERPAPADLAHAQNARNLLAKLDVLLDDAQGSESVRAAHESVRAALKDAF